MNLLSNPCLPSLPEDAKLQPLSWLSITRGKNVKSIQRSELWDLSWHWHPPPKRCLTYLRMPTGQRAHKHHILDIPRYIVKAQALHSHNTQKWLTSHTPRIADRYPLQPPICSYNKRFLLHLFIYVCTFAVAVRRWLQETVLSFYHMGSRNQIQVVRLRGS